MDNNKSNSRRTIESRLFRLYIGNGNWVNLTREVTEELREIYEKGKATRYELSPGLFFDILPNDVDCNSKNTDLAYLMRVDLCYNQESNDNNGGGSNSEEETQQRLSKYIKNQLEQQGIIDAFPPTKKSDDKLPRVTALPSHRHLSMVPTPPTSVSRRGANTTSAHTTIIASTSSSSISSRNNNNKEDDLAVARTSSSSTQSPVSSNSKKTTSNKKRKVKRRSSGGKQESSITLQEVPTYKMEMDGLDPLSKDRMVSATIDQELQYHYYSIGQQQHQQIMLSATPSSFRHLSTTPYYTTTDKGLLFRTPSPPMLSDLSLDRHHHSQHHHHHHEVGSIDSAENSHTFYGANNVLSNTDEKPYSLLSLSHEPQNWTRCYSHSRSHLLDNPQSHHEHNTGNGHSIVAAAVAAAAGGSYGYYNQHTHEVDKLQDTQSYQMVASALQHQHDASIHNNTISLSNSSSPQSLLIPPAASSTNKSYSSSSCATATTTSFFPSTNYSTNSQSSCIPQQHQQSDYERPTTGFMIDSEQPSQDD
ncbi:hypothetical protein BDA99DRAFT_533310 [Phascolomyces articulosus]|uniref:Uncharacterized protein n=1 Tax=Phascolomyces articulosus TaxID=60185 RepID=A0AAD5KLJ6_9FUNG|nr:hypothetical protein BDA99DRAFT_533310 [Phascolomyces articulosus]